MKWAFGIRRKISAALLLSAIFVLVFVKNMLDNQNVTKLGNSFSSVYEDRLMVESYIFRLSEHLFRKKIMIDTTSTQVKVAAIRPLVEGHNAAIGHIISEYEKTRLTEAEARFFKDFKGNIEALGSLESTYFRKMYAENDADHIKDQIDEEFNRASINLGHLSSIQISEGKLLNEHSQKIVADSSLLTQFEMGILIAIGLMILVLVFESSSIFSGAAHKQSLN